MALLSGASLPPAQRCGLGTAAWIVREGGREGGRVGKEGEEVGREGEKEEREEGEEKEEETERETG